MSDICEKSVLKCIHCGELENLHINYAYGLPNIPIESILCNECGKFTNVETQQRGHDDSR